MPAPAFPALLPAPPDAAQRISPTDVSQYIRLDQCQRYLRLRLHERAHGRRFLERYGVAPQSIPPLLTRAGGEFEAAVAAAAARHVGGAVDCRAAAIAGDPAFTGPDHNAVILARAAGLGPGERALLFQPRLRVTIGPWELRGDVDILLLERGAAGGLRALIADVKSSTAAKVEHRLQVAFYHEMLEAICARAGAPLAAAATAILYRGPAPGARPLAPAEQARLDAQRADALALLGVEGALLERVDDPEAYREEVRSLVTGDGSVAAGVAAAPFERLPFHLTYKCDGCLYNEFCMRWAAEHDDLSLIPYLSDSEKNALQAAGVATARELAGLKQFVDAGSVELAAPAEQLPTVYALGASRAVGPRIDELVHRARRYRRWRGDDLRALASIPSKGYGSLPAVDAALHPNLVRVYLDVQHDYLNDRVYLLGALVAACAGGAEDPARRRCLVRMSEAPPADPAAERALLTGWIAETIRAVVELAAPDAEGRRRAPIHLIFVDRFAQRLLLDALARHFGAVAGGTPLYDFITQIAGFDSPVATLLEEERRELKNDPLVCPSLQALARLHGFDWGEYRERFRVRMFDEVGRLDEAAEGPAAWYTSRARFNSQIPLEYAYAAWGELPAPAAGPDDLAGYRRASPELLRGFQARRLEAIEHLTRDFRGNRQTEKTPFDLPELAGFEQTARSLADALHEFLTLERHTALAAWKRARLAPPERRVLAGASLVLRYDAADQPPELLAALAENERRRALKREYEAAFLAANPARKRATLTPAQKEATRLEPISWPFRLRIDLAGVDCDLDTALKLSGFAAGDRVILAPRWDVDGRLPPEQQAPYTPTAKQLLYAPRAQIAAIDPAGFVELTLAEGGSRGDGRYTFGYAARPLLAGERYTIESDPNDIYGKRCEEIVEGLRAGAANALYARLASPAAERARWPEPAAEGQRRFAEGLDALLAAGLLHPFDENQRAYIAGLGAAPTLLVQGPPGTGKSYSTAFALLARLQGALAAGQTFRALLCCKTHAATEVLLEKIAEVQAALRRTRERDPELFDRHFDPEILAAPLIRVSPRDPARAWPGPVRVVPREEASAVIGRQPACFAAITPFATAAACKTPEGYFGQRFCDCLILDEASQMNLPEAMMAALPLRDDGQLIVVGDHRQMPPIVQHAWADERRRTFQEYRSYASLFEALLAREPAPPIVRFAESFRLHRDIARFLRDAIYTQDGIDYHSRQTATLAGVAHGDPFLDAVLAPAHPLVVVVHDEARSQVLNPYELRLISPILQALAGPHRLDASRGLGVVVPHRAQRAALKAALPGLMEALLDGGLDDAAVDTVERFQGGERTAILVSATESDRDYLRTAGEFLLDPRRLNVALSRAKQKLILVASRSVFSVFAPDEESFAHAQLWKRLLRRTCTALLWEGEREGQRVQVWGNTEG